LKILLPSVFNASGKEKGMVLHEQLSTSSGLGCNRNKKNIFLLFHSHILSGSTTAQAVGTSPSIEISLHLVMNAQN
jgi:hypothetical protein